jgi:uncharacterized protein (DUF4415 family)
MRFTWDETKRRANLKGHEIDFVDAERVFAPSLTRKFGSFHFDEQPPMKKRFSLQASKTNFRRLRSQKAADVKITRDHPELDINHIARVIVRKGLKAVPPKESVSLRIDADVLAWFRARGAGYQTRINAVLRAFKEAAL